jgi:hypothetical protein
VTEDANGERRGGGWFLMAPLLVLIGVYSTGFD